MDKTAAIPMRVVLAALAEQAQRSPPQLAKKVVSGKAQEAAKRVVKAIMMPEGFISKGLPPEIASGGQPAKAKIGILARLFKDMEKGSAAVTVGDAYLYGFLQKYAQAQAAIKKQPDLTRQFLDAVPPNPTGGQTTFEDVLSAGKIGLRDIGLKDISKLDPKRITAMEAAIKKNLTGAAEVEEFLAAKNPYGSWGSPVRHRAFKKVRKGYNPMLTDFIKRNPDLIRKFIAARQAPKEVQ